MDTAPRSVFLAAITIALLAGVAIRTVTTLELPMSPVEDEADREHRVRKLEQMRRACEARMAALDDLLTGRRSLSQTAATFRELTNECPFDVLPALRNLHPGASDDELHYLHVIHYVEAFCRRTGTDPIIMEPLRHELELRRTSGTLRCVSPPGGTAHSECN